MQRRAAAMYVAFFLIIAVGSIAFISLAEPPSEAMAEYDHQLAVDDTVVIDDTEYTLTRIDAFSATLAWTEEAAEQTETIANESEIEIDGIRHRVEILDEDPDAFFLQELYPDHGLDTVEIEGRTYVVITENDEDEFVLEKEYLEQEFGEVARLELTAGDQFYYDAVNQTVTVESIDAAGVQVGWIGPEERSMTVSRGEAAEIGETTYVANFVGQEFIQLTTDTEQYEAHADALETWDERYRGFWGIGVLSFITAILIGAMSFLPRRR